MSWTSLPERDSRAFLRWLRPYVERLGAQVRVSDDLATYKPAVDELGLEHQVCLAHMRKTMGNRLERVALSSCGWSGVCGVRRPCGGWRCICCSAGPARSATAIGETSRRPTTGQTRPLGGR